MSERPVTCHPEFEKVAARYRNAIRRRDHAAIDRARADLNRLTREVAQAEAWRKAAELAFTTPNTRRKPMATWNEADTEARTAIPRGGSNVLVKLKEDGERIVLAIVGEPHVYRRRSFDDRSKETKRFLVNVFVPDDAMKVLEMTVPTFASLTATREKISFEKQLICIERDGKPRDPETSYRVATCEPISTELAAKIAASPLHDLEQIAAKRTAHAARGRPAPGAAQPHKVATPDRRSS